MEKKKIKRVGLLGRLRNYFLAGILVTAPVSITIYLAYSFITYIDAKVEALVPQAYHPESYLPFSIPGMGVIVVIVSLILVGALTAGLMGRIFIKTYESILTRMPVVRGIYNTLKQIFETVFSQQSQAFREVVLVEFAKGFWMLGFVTGKTRAHISRTVNHDVYSVFVPTTPNPTTGILLFTTRRHLKPLNLGVEDAFKMILSSGIVGGESDDVSTLLNLPKLNAPARKSAKSVKKKKRAS